MLDGLRGHRERQEVNRGQQRSAEVGVFFIPQKMEVLPVDEEKRFCLAEYDPLRTVTQVGLISSEAPGMMIWQGSAC